MTLARRTKHIPLWILVALAFSGRVHAASFDCLKAHSKVERLVCENPEISSLDEKMAEKYNAALQTGAKHDALRSSQLVWLKERNACTDIGCLRARYRSRIDTLQSTLDRDAGRRRDDISRDVRTSPVSGAPGYYRVHKSTNDSVCTPLHALVNSDIASFGKLRFDTHPQFQKWRAVEEDRIDRGSPGYDGPVEEALVDITNDGTVDQVIRTRWSVRGSFSDMLTIPSTPQDRLAIVPLIRSSRNITFDPPAYWLQRHQKKYGAQSFDWIFLGVASIDLMTERGTTYLVAANYAAPPDITAKIHVLRVNPGASENAEDDVCMFLRDP